MACQEIISLFVSCCGLDTIKQCLMFFIHFMDGVFSYTFMCHFGVGCDKCAIMSLAIHSSYSRFVVKSLSCRDMEFGVNPSVTLGLKLHLVLKTGFT
jgi:hypothetical protein